MEFMKFLIKTLIILAMVLFMALPFLIEFYTFRSDKNKKISYKRFRVVIYTVVYAIAATLILYLFKEVFLLAGSFPFVKWLVTKVALSNRTLYFTRVLAVILINFGIGLLYSAFSKFVRVGLKKKNLTIPKGNGDFDWKQKAERAVIKFFHNETWFYVGRILKYLNIILSVAYALVFIIYQIPAVFGASWIPYKFISLLFDSGYLYPTLTLVVLWQVYFFIEGIKCVESECPELLENATVQAKECAVDLDAIDAEVRKQFKDFYVCDVDLSNALREELSSTEHHHITECIAQAVENDKRNPQARKEVYLNCVDRIVESNNGLLINGNFFSEFSMYFLRYLSAVIARGDNVVFVCNTDAQIDMTYDYIVQGLSEISSLYCAGFQSDSVDFDDPIWRIAKVSGEHENIGDVSVDENNILVTSLGYLCSARFENEHSKFISLIDAVVFIDTLNTVNKFNRQLSILNTQLKHITRKNSLAAKNSNINDMIKVRYMTRKIRYYCFDDTRTSGLDKVLKNMLGVEIDSVDAMNYNSNTIVRCYNYEGKPDENGRRNCPHFLNSDEEVGAVLNMAVLCIAKGASNVSVYADDILPYCNMAETIAANMGKISIKADEKNIRINKQFYNPDSFSVIIAVDSGNNLPAALRKYISMVSDKPVLVILFSRPYMLRDYYIDNINSVWNTKQIERIPVEDGTEKDVAQKILIKANAGGISKAEVISMASVVSRFNEYVAADDVDSILREVLRIYGVSQDERLDLFRYFEYVSSREFDENGKYNSEIRVVLRKYGKLFDLINGRNMVVMNTGTTEIALPIPKSRLTQNFIAGQNLVHNGNIYHINKIDTASGRLYVKLAVGGKNDETYKYVQNRNYRLDFNPEQVEFVFPSKHVAVNRKDADVSINDVYISAFRAPMEVLTKGYFDVDPHTLAANSVLNEYHSISDLNNDELAKQVYRRYGRVTAPAYSSESILKSTNLVSNEKGALVMSVRINGEFGPDVNKTVSLAAMMLGEIISSMFPSVSDSVAVCPVIRGEFSTDDSQLLEGRYPSVNVIGENEMLPSDGFELLIIEDCVTDLGVVSVLMSAGDDVLNTLFSPVYNYLKWRSEAEEKSDYLLCGLDHEPDCFDFDSVQKLSKLLGDNKHDLKYVDIKTLIEYEVCNFCGKRYVKGDTFIELNDGRKMCKACAGSIAGNNKKILKAHFDSAKIFLESTYGVVLDNDFEFCFESTVKIVNTIKQNRNIIRRGADVPLKSYVDDKKKVHIECSIPSVNLSELIVRELTHTWQLKNLPGISEENAEGHIALVAVQYLMFLNQQSLASSRISYYESTGNASGEGYRKLVSELIANPQFNNNPFRYLLEKSNVSIGDKLVITGNSAVTDFGLPYTPESFDRFPADGVDKFWYSRLTDSCKTAYDAMIEAIRNHTDTVTVSGCTFDDIDKASEAIEYDHPELFWYKTFSVCGEEVNLFYGATPEEVAVLQRRIDEVVPQFLLGIDDSMSAYDVAVRIHVKIISSVDYDTIALNKQKKEGGPPKDKIDYLRTICGVFLEGKAVCEGYARAVQYLLQKCGIECAEVAGYIRKETGEKNGAHAWNIVRVDGDYYYLDSTWDDSSNTVQTVKINDLGFDYFFITTDELRKTRDLELNPVDLPLCTATRANYFYHNGLVLDAYDLNKIKEIARNAANNKNKFFTFKCTSKALYEQALSSLCASGQDCYEALKVASKADRKILADSYTYSYDKNMWTITVNFKYR